MTPTATPTPEHRCPVCGEPNGCAPARTGRFDTPCWCTTVVIQPSALERVPPQQLGRACLCRNCATGGGCTTPPGDTPGA